AATGAAGAAGAAGASGTAGGRPVRLILTNPLPAGKGFGTSTADIAAALAAVSAWSGAPLTAEEVAALAARVEPTDGSMLEGLVCFDHRSGRLLERLPPLPPLEVLALDTGGRVDSVAFNRREDLAAAERAKEPAVREALQVLRQALRAGDPEGVGAAATLSAFAHQVILPKPALASVWRVGHREGAVGVAVAHSGTLIGLLFDARRRRADEVRGVLERKLGRRLRVFRAVPGGLVVEGVRAVAS
ncbi:MAG: hypothetical protein IRY95_06455, partial [Clostridia bacterium]|nr:hypothetical protein [Clostridia bacterium]